MTDEYRLFIRDNAIDAEMALFNLRNSLRGTGIDEMEVWANRIDTMRVRVGELTCKLERMGRDEEE